MWICRIVDGWKALSERTEIEQRDPQESSIQEINYK